MKNNYLLILCMASMLYGCKKDEQSSVTLSADPPKMPATATYDLNNDSSDDIKIEYRGFTWDGYRSSGDGISGLIEPLNETALWLKRDDYTLFAKVNDTIKLSPKEPYYWEKYSNPDLVSISNSSANNYLWPNRWIIMSNMTLDAYYVGIKLSKNDGNLLGWIKMTIDQSTGGIRIVDKKFTRNEYIVIGK